MAISSTDDNNGLTSLMDQAAKDPLHSPACYAGLMSTSVYVVVEQNEQDSELLCWDEGGLAVVPCFTSLDSLRDFLNEMIDKTLLEEKPNYSYLHMPIKELFHSDSKAAIHVDPMAESECVLMPHDIEYLICSDEKPRDMAEISQLATRKTSDAAARSSIQ